MRCNSATAPATVIRTDASCATGMIPGKAGIPVDVKSGDLLFRFAITFGGKVKKQPSFLRRIFFANFTGSGDILCLFHF